MPPPRLPAALVGWDDLADHAVRPPRLSRRDRGGVDGPRPGVTQANGVVHLQDLRGAPRDKVSRDQGDHTLTDLDCSLEDRRGYRLRGNRPSLLDKDEASFEVQELELLSQLPPTRIRVFFVCPEIIRRDSNVVD